MRLLPGRLQHLDDLRLDRDVERGRRLVRDEHARVVGDRHRDHRALAHPTGELVRMLIDTALRIRNPDELEQLHGALPRVVLAPVRVVREHRLGDLVTDGQDRVQRRHRVLEDHRHVAAADLAKPLLPQLQQVLTLEDRLALGDPGARAQPEDGQHRDALAGARLADDAEHLARLEVVGDVRDCLDDAVLGLELDCQIANRENRIRHELSAESGRARRACRRRRS